MNRYDKKRIFGVKKLFAKGCAKRRSRETLKILKMANAELDYLCTRFTPHTPCLPPSLLRKPTCSNLKATQTASTRQCFPLMSWALCIRIALWVFERHERTICSFHRYSQYLAPKGFDKTDSSLATMNV